MLLQRNLLKLIICSDYDYFVLTIMYLLRKNNDFLKYIFLSFHTLICIVYKYVRMNKILTKVGHKFTMANVAIEII